MLREVEKIVLVFVRINWWEIIDIEENIFLNQKIYIYINVKRIDNFLLK